ncbi:transglycosylase domain-containing protein [Streptomyces sp. AM 3-1-1]|uniref:transglycosylase domain-containing protein n=1 Tax=Streptomyces sp. AM 3-1-1 TaxID=3028711 RepID=UPI0023B95BD6|nr:transglycosylase domain-containing protein [Streptomyces sp. AM 3-1-1]WEH28610.1 transglycosylase domain-containing protein [Streptomyces sp. AM 3-1-1]
MSEHRRKPPQPEGGGRAAARRARSGNTGRRATPRGSAPSSSAHGSAGVEPPSHGGGRAEARRAAQRGSGGRRRAAPAAGQGGGRRGGPPAKKRFIDYPRAGKDGVGRWLPSWKLVTGLFVAFIGGLMGIAGIAYAMVEVPDEALSARAQNNVYYWSDGSQMVATGGESQRNRQIVPLDQIDKSMQYAVISAENKSFETDSGVDPMGIGRALFNMAKGGQTQGGSTITQQYVKNAVLDDQEQTLSRKFKELFISIKVGTTKSKDEIMAGYLNTAYYGRSAYGIQAASRAYFDKDAVDLNASESALLAAVLKGATYYDPAGVASDNPAKTTKEANTLRATERWSWILDEEVKDGHLSKSERDKYTDLPKTEPPRANSALGGQVGYLVELANSWVTSHSEDTGITLNKLNQGGYRIYTTFKKDRVKELEKSVSKVYNANIDPKKRPKTDSHVQFGGASVNANTGAIEAIYGGTDALKHWMNNADVTGAQVGSTFKPFVLAAAMQHGVRDPKLGANQGDSTRRPVSQMSIFSAKNKLKIKNYDGSIWTDKNGDQWLQSNDGDESYHSDDNYRITLREAMQHSVNSAFVQLGMDVGLDKVKDAAIKAGIQDGPNIFASNNYPSFSLGTSSPSAIRMAGAYATFANEGEQNDPYSVTKVESEKGTLFQHKKKSKSAFPKPVADNVTDVLKNVVEKGTGTSAKIPGRDVAGKTGTTDGNKSAWFVGYTPQVSTAIAMFRFDDNAKNKQREFEKMYGTGNQTSIHGASFPAEIWKDYMTLALKDAPTENFPKPEKIGEVVETVDAPPSPSTKPSESPSESPSKSPSQSPSSEAPPSPSTTESENTCGPLDFNCQHGGDDEGPGGGDDQGGDNQGPGQTSGPPSPSLPGEGDPGGDGDNGDNGWFKP